MELTWRLKGHAQIDNKNHGTKVLGEGRIETIYRRMLFISLHAWFITICTSPFQIISQVNFLQKGTFDTVQASVSYCSL